MIPRKYLYKIVIVTARELHSFIILQFFAPLVFNFLEKKLRKFKSGIVKIEDFKIEKEKENKAINIYISILTMKPKEQVDKIIMSLVKSLASLSISKVKSGKKGRIFKIVEMVKAEYLGWEEPTEKELEELKKFVGF